MAVAGGIVAIAFWPGHMSNDTFSAIEQARTGELTNQHAPLLNGLWHVGWSLGVGPGDVLVIQVVTLLAGIYLVLRSAMSAALAGVVACFVLLWPPVLGMAGYLSRDTWFVATLLVALGAAGRAHRSTGEGTWWVVLSIVAATLAVAARQNAITAVVVVLVLLAPALVRALSRTRMGARIAARQRLAALGVGVALSAVLYLGQGILQRAVGVDDVSPEQYLYVYDLSAMSKRTGVNLVPSSVLPDRSLAVFDRHFFDASVRPMVLAADAPIQGGNIGSSGVEALQDAWRRSIQDHPGEYLAGRVRLFGLQLGIASAPIWAYHPRIDPNDMGFRIENPSVNDVATDYLDTFTAANNAGGVLHRPWPYLLAAAVAMFLVIRWKALREGAVFLAAGAAAFTYQAGLFAGAMFAEYRLEFPAVTLAIVAVVGTVAIAVQRQRRPHPA